MILYHGSNVVVERPEIRVPNRNLDFGMGFYTTTNVEQAQSFSEIVCNRRGGKKVISLYEFDYENAVSTLELKTFEKADSEWFDFVCEKRMGNYDGDDYDIIIGPVANDTVYRTFIGFLAGATSREDAIRQLKVRDLYDQVTFCTEEVLKYLKYKGVL
jgi:hypothetical protein